MDKVKDLQTKVNEGSISRAALIKGLRKARMAAIDAKDEAGMKFFDNPVEVIANEMLSKAKSQ